MSAPSLDGYRHFLAERDGTPNLRRGVLPVREAFFARLEADPVSSRRRIDPGAFLHHLRARRPRLDLDQLTLWLLATAKANQAERFGVGLAELYGRVGSSDGDPIRVHVNLQEHYHTRILAGVVEMFGLVVPPDPPPRIARALVRALVFSPERPALPLIGCSEMVGCVVFRALRDRGVALCSEEPEVAERLRLLYDEILADEIGHVGFVAARLGMRGRRLMRTLFSTVGRRMVQSSPELSLLYRPEDLAARVRGFSLSKMVDDLPDRAYAGALI